MRTIARIVALGASNLTRGLPTLVSVARATWGNDIEIFAALGHGRSFGKPSRVFVRTLPGILQSGLWRRLKELAPIPTLGLITDVGNDILYGADVQQILDWVSECAARLRRVALEVVLTDLPLERIQRLTPLEFLLFRTAWFPRCRLSMQEVLAAAERLSDGLSALAADGNLRLYRLKPEWYGLDPIHIRFRQLRLAWKEILRAKSSETPGNKVPLFEALRMYLLPPERRGYLGFKRFTPQHGVALRSGGRLWLY